MVFLFTAVVINANLFDALATAHAAFAIFILVVVARAFAARPAPAAALLIL
jgi:hypothetical protein